MLSQAALADETDQFTLPPRETFADMGPFLTAVHYDVLAKVVDEANERIDRSLRNPSVEERQAELDRLHSPGYLADQVRGIFGAGFFEMRAAEEALRPEKFDHTLAAGKVPAYRTLTWIYFYTHLPIDPRKLPLLFQASTVKAYGSYFGTDKLGHFHDLGHLYFKDYLSRRKEGMTDKKALDWVIDFYSNGPISEKGAIGFYATGVMSNADLASNYMGMKFYRNLSEPVMLKGKESPPLLVRRGAYWRLNKHVRPESDFFAPFISDHWNEALNPCVYEWGIRWSIENRMRDMADDIRAFYAAPDGHERPREYFEKLASELSTYYGEDYGHGGTKDEMLLIGEVCYQKDTPATTGNAAPTGSSTPSPKTAPKNPARSK